MSPILLWQVLLITILFELPLRSFVLRNIFLHNFGEVRHVCASLYYLVVTINQYERWDSVYAQSSDVIGFKTASVAVVLDVPCGVLAG